LVIDDWEEPISGEEDADEQLIGSGPAQELILEVGCCSVLQCVVAVRCSVLQRVADEVPIGSGPAQELILGVVCCSVCCSVLLQCVTVCCNVLQMRCPSVVARHKS